MSSKTKHDQFIDWIDTTWKQWLIGIVAALMIVGGPIVAATVRTPPGVALLCLGSILVHFLVQSRGNATKSQEK